MSSVRYVCDWCGTVAASEDIPGEVFFASLQKDGWVFCAGILYARIAPGRPI